MMGGGGLLRVTQSFLRGCLRVMSDLVSRVGYGRAGSGRVGLGRVDGVVSARV